MAPDEVRKVNMNRSWLYSIWAGVWFYLKWNGKPMNANELNQKL